MLSGPRSGIRSTPAPRTASTCAAALLPEPLSATSVREDSTQTSQNASPPMPHALPMTTESTALVAIAASTAVPPARRTPRPAAVAR
jgi:hypothetical protein